MTHRGDRCPDCDAPVLWVTMHSGAKIPIDPEPNAEGTVCMTTDRDTGERYAWWVEEGGGNAAIYTNHFATCPDANAWARRTNERNGAK